MKNIRNNINNSIEVDTWYNIRKNIWRKLLDNWETSSSYKKITGMKNGILSNIEYDVYIAIKNQTEK